MYFVIITRSHLLAIVCLVSARRDTDKKVSPLMKVWAEMLRIRMFGRSWSGPWSSYSSLEWSREEDLAREGRGRINTTTGSVGSVGTDKHMDKGGSGQYLK